MTDTGRMVSVFVMSSFISGKRKMMNPFDRDIYEELLEESSFLYELRIARMNDNDTLWPKIREIEDRLDCQIHALSTGGEPALDYCSERITGCDMGELYTIVAVFCRQERQDLVETVIAEADLSDDERLKAVADALSFELSDSLQEDVLSALFDTGGIHAVLASMVAGNRRGDVAEELYTIIRGSGSIEKKGLIRVLHALGRIRPEFGAEQILRFLYEQDREIVNSAIIALIRIGEHQALKEIMAFIGPKEWPKLSLGLYGGRDCLSDVFYSASALSDEGLLIDKDLALASGLIGNIRAIPELIEWLSDDAIAENAALALFLITGATLYEQHFIPEEIDEDDLFEDELEKHKKGELYAPGEASGETITRLSQNPSDWQSWWDKNKSAFNPSIRYRNGRPCCPQCLLDTLKSDTSTDISRKLAYEELVIRYGMDVPFETDMPVSQQLHALEQYETLLSVNQGRFRVGEWYYNGKPLENDELFLAGETTEAKRGNCRNPVR